MKYSFFIDSRKRDLEKALDGLVEFESLVSNAITDRFADVSSINRSSIETSAASDFSDWGEDAVEQLLDNERTFNSQFPQLALRGVFLSAASYVEKFLRFLAFHFNPNQRGRALSTCRETLNENWTESNDETKHNEDRTWEEFAWYMEIRNLLLHVDERNSARWNSKIRNAFESLRCESCRQSNSRARNCEHLAGRLDGALVLGREMPREFIGLSRRYIAIHLEQLSSKPAE